MSAPRRRRFRLTCRPRGEPLEQRRLLAGDLAEAANSVPRIVISEIMYHPASDRAADEFLELLNPGDRPVQLGGWQLSRGVHFVFPAYELQAGQRLVIAADRNAFADNHPAVDQVLGDWEGRLSNRGETIELVDAGGVLVDAVRYADQGEWAVRVAGELDRGHRGWSWQAAHDGDGYSLELVNPRVTNDSGQNWRTSLVRGGTPGSDNSVASLLTAPLIQDVQHSPPLPLPTERVTITARIDSLDVAQTDVMLHYRRDGQPTYDAVSMFDDGLEVDHASGDGIFTASIPSQPIGAIIQFHITATGPAGISRTWPAIDLGESNEISSTRPDALYQVVAEVDRPDVWNPHDQPITYLVMTRAEAAELADIGDGPLDEALSNAQMNATFIRVDGRGTHIRYLAGVRNRGGASRIGPPNNYRVNFAHDDPWDEAYSLTFNGSFVDAEILGNAIYRLAGLPAPNAFPVQVRINGVDAAHPAIPGGSTVFSQLEVVDGHFIDRHFPDDNRGNLYRAEAAGSESSDLRYEGPVAEAYQDTYTKATNEDDDDWQDLIELTDVLNNAPDDQFRERVSQVIDVDQWMRYLALDSLLGNRETGLATASGDNYWLYRGAEDTRFRLIPHDLDTLMGVGRVAQPNRSIFAYTAIPGLARLLTHRDTVPLYYQAFVDLMETVFNPTVLQPVIEQLLAGIVSSEQRDAFHQFIEERMEGVRAQLPREFAVTSTLPVVSGYARSTQPTTELFGTADALRTKSVLVNGVPADWSPLSREWSLRPQGDVTTEELVGLGQTWSYLDNGTEPSNRWRTAEFDDTLWKTGAAPLGYGHGDEATVVNFGPNSNDKYITTYLRHRFRVDSTDNLIDLTLRLQRDDGAVVYLNGQEIARSNLPAGSVDFQTVASQWVGPGQERQMHSFSVDPSLLLEGDNLLAVEVHQRSAIDNDLWFDLSLEATTGSPTGGVLLLPGINRVYVQAFDEENGTGQQLQRGFVDVWYDGAAGIDVQQCAAWAAQGTMAPSILVSGVLSEDTVLAPCGPAYTIAGELTVPAGITLTVMPGTTVFFQENASIVVQGGRLVAEGTEYRPIRMTRVPGSAASWNGLQFRDSREDNRLRHAILEYAATADGMVGLEGSRLTIENATFDHADRFRIRTINSSLVLRDSHFTDIFAPGEPPTTDNRSEHLWGSGILPGGQLVIEGNYFGTTKGHNDAIDFDGAERPGPIPIIRDNIFAGSGDDLLDLESDAHIEGNVFQNVAKDEYNIASGDANAISAGGGRHFVVVRNVFQNVDHAVQVKDDAFLIFQHNTVYDTRDAAIYFDLDERSPGRGALVEDSILWTDAPTFGSVESTTDLVVNRSIVASDAVAYGVDNVIEDPRLIDPASGDLRLAAGSPALATGLAGTDRGAFVSPGMHVHGEPESITAQRDIDLIVAGAGMIAYRYRTVGGPWSDPQSMSQPISLRALADGVYWVEIIGQDSAGHWQDGSQAKRSRTWQVDGSLRQLRINEILADNRSSVAVGASYPDLIELYNAGNMPVDLSGMSLSDDPARPRRFVFPPGTRIEPNGYLVLSSEAVPGNDLLAFGFGLDREGETLSLFDTLPNGGGQLDSVTFGLQAANLSIGRLGSDATWGLTQPTFGRPNVAQPLGDVRRVAVNEWLARGEVLLRDDFIELYNRDTLPVSLSGLYLTDDPVSRPLRHELAPLSFVAGNGYAVYWADRAGLDNESTHLPFRLAADQGQIALIDSQGQIIDQVLYAWQTIDISQGRLPDGTSPIRSQQIPSPGTENLVSEPSRTAVVPLEATWHYLANGQTPPVNWTELSFDDSVWNSGAGVLAAEDGQLPATVRTELPRAGFVSYYRHRFTLEDLPQDGHLELTALVDDGAIFSVNGVEFLRLGMPDGPVDGNTRATRGVGNAEFEGPFVVPRELLRPGENVLAVQVHQIVRTNSDVVMGALLERVAQRSEPRVDQAQSLLAGLRLTEIMYHPADDDEREFIELTNVSSSPIDLTGVQVAGGIAFTFHGRTLQAGERLVLARNVSALTAYYGPGLPIGGQYEGSLSNSGEELRLLLPWPEGGIIQQVTYSDRWYASTDGSGYSLVLGNEAAVRADLRAADAWRRSTAAGGSPGQPDLPLGDLNGDNQRTVADLNLLCAAIRSEQTGRMWDLDQDGLVNQHDVTWWLTSVKQSAVGDANLDGWFTSSDLVLIFQAGFFERTDVTEVGWSAGDWNCDGQFTTSDLVLAFQAGRYRRDR